jgi:hypothetical protein
MRILYLLLVLITAISSTAADAQKIQRIDVTEFGIYSNHTEKAVAAPGTASGVTLQLSDVKLVKATDRVPATPDVEFGFRYNIVGRRGDSVKLKKVVHIPQPGIRNPQTGNTTVQSESVFSPIVGSAAYTGYTLNHPWEIVTGTWTIELWDGDRKLASQSFDVVAP